MLYSFLSYLPLLAIVVSAAPVPQRGPPPPKRAGGCDLSQAKPDLPAGQTSITVPSGAPSFVGIALGVQNYTCNATTSTYTNVGAVADIYDGSCLIGTPGYASAQASAFDTWSKAAQSATPDSIVAQTPLRDSPELGQHYFVKNPTTGVGVSPKWDFTSSGATKGNANAFVIGAKKASLTAPAGNSTDVDWLELSKVQGDLADTVLRVDTKNGQPPTSCTPGSADIQVKYSATYYLYGGTVKQ